MVYEWQLDAIHTDRLALICGPGLSMRAQAIYRVLLLSPLSPKRGMQHYPIWIVLHCPPLSKIKLSSFSSMAF